ncbi:MAG: RidA family protein [Kiritimatiellia bacterium]
MKIINTPNAPQAIGPYSQGIEFNGMVFLSGQIPLNPRTMELAGSDIEAQTAQVFENIKAVLAAAELSLGNVVKTTVFLKNIGDFSGMNKVYARYFAEHKPTRSTIEVARLPKDSLIEIECIAMASEKENRIVL